MPKFTVECEDTRIFSWTIDVEAVDEDDAERQVLEMYDSWELHMNGPDSDESLDGLTISIVVPPEKVTAE